MRDLRRLPKAELHVHLESTVRTSTLREIARSNGVNIPPHLAGGEHSFGGFADFFAHNALVRACLCRAQDFRRIAVEFCEDAAAEGTRYAEVSFTAAAHGERVGDLDMPLVAVLDGLAEGQSNFGLQVQVLFSTTPGGGRSRGPGRPSS
jgi:adenosine deaminase